MVGKTGVSRSGAAVGAAGAAFFLVKGCEEGLVKDYPPTRQSPAMNERLAA